MRGRFAGWRLYRGRGACPDRGLIQLLHPGADAPGEVISLPTDGLAGRDRSTAVTLHGGNGHMRESLLTAQVGELLGVPPSWVYEQSRRGRIPTVTLGRYRRYRRETIKAWLEQLEGNGTNGGPRHRAF